MLQLLECEELQNASNDKICRPTYVLTPVRAMTTNKRYFSTTLALLMYEVHLSAELLSRDVISAMFDDVW